MGGIGVVKEEAILLLFPAGCGRPAAPGTKLDLSKESANGLT